MNTQFMKCWFIPALSREMIKNKNKTIHLVIGFPGIGSEKLNKYCDYYYGRKEAI